MIGMPQRRETCRIVVGLKPAAQIELPVEAAATLAAAIEAEMVGLFVREDAMIDLAGLPFARAFGFGAGRPLSLTREAMEQAFARCEATCRRTLSARAELARVKWSFSTMRGELPVKISAELTTGDFLVISGGGRGPGGHGLVDEIRSAPADVQGVVIAAAQEAARSGGPFIAVDHGAAAGEKTVRLAMRIAAVSGAQPVLFVIAADVGQADRIARRGQQLAGAGTRLIVHRFLPGAPQSIATAFSRLAPSFVVADLEGEPFSDDQAVRTLLRAAGAPVALLRLARPPG